MHGCFGFLVWQAPWAKPAIQSNIWRLFQTTHNAETLSVHHPLLTIQDTEREKARQKQE
jgi:hypothetical protein